MYAGKGLQDVTPRSHPVQNSVIRRGQAAWDAPSPLKAVREQMGDHALAFVALFVTPDADFAGVVAEARSVFDGAEIMACTTAGEIGSAGYDAGQIIAVGFPARDFCVRTRLIRDIDKLDAQQTVDRVTLDRLALQQERPELQDAFAFLVVDGLSLSEERLAATIAPALGDIPIFGGSAGDGTRFERTMVALNGEVAGNAAVLTMVRSRYRTRVFSLNHLEPTDRKMVVTGADPARRIVKSINAEPAAREYARIVGKDPAQLDQFTMAAHPVVVRIGTKHHVRAIQQINAAGEMVFFSAIDEGMVLTVARPLNLLSHLEAELQALADDEAPTDIIACDCVLRRIEAEQSQLTRPMSEILSRHNVVGFSTYGEQIGPLHVNQTLSGVAFYRSSAPEAATASDPR
jgi:hypothetical protein